MTRRPNPRLQRTRLRAPLSRKPLGRTLRKVLLVFLVLGYSSCLGRQTLRQQPARLADRLFSATLCPVHNIGLVPKEVPILYGHSQIEILVPGSAAYAAERTSASRCFPYASHMVRAGCEILAGSSLYETQWFCPACDQAEQEWTRQHPVPQ
jgi:hypothetical protein